MTEWCRYIQKNVNEEISESFQGGKPKTLYRQKTKPFKPYIGFPCGIFILHFWYFILYVEEQTQPKPWGLSIHTHSSTQKIISLISEVGRTNKLHSRGPLLSKLLKQAALIEHMFALPSGVNLQTDPQLFSSFLTHWLPNYSYDFAPKWLSF